MYSEDENKNKNQNQTQAHILARLMVVEQQLLTNDKIHDKIVTSVDQLNDKITDIKMGMVKNEDISKIVENLSTLNTTVSSVQLELSNMEFVKKLGSHILTAVLTIVVGWVLTSTLNNGNIGNQTVNSNNQQNSPEIKQKLDDILKKLEYEYMKKQ